MAEYCDEKQDELGIALRALIDHTISGKVKWDAEWEAQIGEGLTYFLGFSNRDWQLGKLGEKRSLSKVPESGCLVSPEFMKVVRKYATQG